MIDSPDTVGLTFSARRSILEPCLHWRLTPEGLLCERESASHSMWASLRSSSLARWPRHILFGEIISIRVRFDPTRFALNRYRCDLLARNGRRISIFSTHYVGPGNFEDRGEQYAEFVRNLVMCAQRNNPSVKLTTGVPWPSYLLQHGFLLASLVALVTMLGIAGIPMLGSAWVKLAIILTYIGVALRYAWVNVPKNLTLPSK